MIDLRTRFSKVAQVLPAAYLIALCAQFAPAAELPPHPRLLLDSNGIGQLKQRISTAPWAKASWTELKTAADRSLSRPVELPPRGGNWSHNYVCPTHGARLTQGRQLGPWQWEHVCPVGRHVLRGDPSKATLDFDGNAISSAHANYAQQTVHDGLLFQVTGDDRYARKAREILLAYAQRYLAYPLHDNQGKMGQGARVASQSLTEASWLIDVAQGADLVWNTLSDAEHQELADKLFRPALDQVILPRRLGIHNIQCRQNSAIGLVGYLLGDERLISTAIDDPAVGYRQQLEKGVRDDGMWLEGSSGYHFFTVAGLWPLAEAARNCGLDLYTSRFQGMFDGPLALAMPNLMLPNFNDSGTVALESQADAYELAYARFHNPAYLALLDGSERRGHLALLFGVSELPARTKSPNSSDTTARSPNKKDTKADTGSENASPSASRNSAASGYAILQRGNDRNATWLCLKYGPHGGGHGHPDKNTFVLYARGEIVATDAGTHAYGSALHRDWDKTTFAHNTLIVDETSQAAATGKCIAFGSERGVDYAITDAGPIYEGISFKRTAAMLTAQLVLFVDQIQANAPHTLDIAYHQLGEWDESANRRAGPRAAKPTPWSPPRAPGYTRFSQTTTRKLEADGLSLKTKFTADLRPGITFAGSSDPAEVITGYGLLKTTEDHVPLLLQRRHAQNTAFVWAITLDGSPVSLKVSRVVDAAGNPLEQSQGAVVHVNSAGHQWTLLVNPDAREVAASLPDGSTWRSKSAFAVR